MAHNNFYTTIKSQNDIENIDNELQQIMQFITYTINNRTKCGTIIKFGEYDAGYSYKFNSFYFNPLKYLTKKSYANLQNFIHIRYLYKTELPSGLHNINESNQLDVIKFIIFQQIYHFQNRFRDIFLFFVTIVVISGIFGGFIINCFSQTVSLENSEAILSFILIFVIIIRNLYNVRQNYNAIMFACQNGCRTGGIDYYLHSFIIEDVYYKRLDFFKKIWYNVTFKFLTKYVIKRKIKMINSYTFLQNNHRLIDIEMDELTDENIQFEKFVKSTNV